MDVSEAVVEKIEKKGLKWFGTLLRVPGIHWPQTMFLRKPPRGRRRFKDSWIGGGAALRNDQFGEG